MKARGKQLLAEGRSSEAYNCFKQCTQINFEMISNVIKACSQFPSVDCIVAPYESDAQLAYFSINNIAHLIITEDSDLVLFSCSNILFKMDGNGRGYLYEKEKLHLSLPANVDFEKFRRACILAGCDYLKGLDGIGLMKAVKFFSKTSRTDIKKVLPFVGIYLRMPSVKVDKDFIEDFICAENTFLYQPIFDVTARRRRPLNPTSFDSLPQYYMDDCLMNSAKACSLAVGRIDPHSGLPVNDFAHESNNPKSIWYHNAEFFNDQCLPGDEQTAKTSPFVKESATKYVEKQFGSTQKYSSLKKRRAEQVEDKVGSILLEYECSGPQTQNKVLKISRYFADRTVKSGETTRGTSQFDSSANSGLQLLDHIDSPSSSKTERLLSEHETGHTGVTFVSKSEDTCTVDSTECIEGPATTLHPNNETSPELSNNLLCISVSPIFSRCKSDIMGRFKKARFNLYSPKESGYLNNIRSDFRLTSSHSSSDSGYADKDTQHSLVSANESLSESTIDASSHTFIDLSFKNDDEHDKAGRMTNGKVLSRTEDNAGKKGLQRCRSMGISRPKATKSVTSTLKQVTIRDSLVSFAYIKP